MLLAVCEVFVILAAVKNGIGWIAFWIGLGSGLGAMASMYLHQKVTGK
jgi:hypothetical protein